MKHISEAIASMIGKGQHRAPSNEQRTNEQVVDSVIANTERVVRSQQEKVLASGKYEHPVHPENHTLKEWVGHQREELADTLVYLECIDQTNDEVIEMLGAVIQYIDQGQHGTARQALIYAIHRLGGGGESK